MTSHMAFPRASARLVAVTLCLCSVVGCDRRGVVVIIEPEFDEIFFFETGFSDWTARGVDLADPTVDWEIARSSDRASKGTQAVRLRLDNLNSQGKIWIERRYTVEEDRLYSVQVSFDFGSADWGDVNLWNVLAGAALDSPAGGGDPSVLWNSGNGESSDQGYQWVPKSFTLETTSDSDGELFVYLGIWGTSAFLRTYYLDNLQVVLTREGFSNL